MSGDGVEDAELLVRAQQGEVGAFAALVHRYAPLLQARTDDRDAVRRAFQRAMRRLDDAEVDDLAGWLLSLLPRAHRSDDAAAPGQAAPPAAGDITDQGATPAAPGQAAPPAAGDTTDQGATPADATGGGGTTDTPRSRATAADVPPLPAREIDALWGELAVRWPRGRRPLRLPRWVGQVALVAVLMVLAVLIPIAVLTTAGGPDPEPAPVGEVEGVPVDDDPFDLTFEDGVP